VRQRWPIGNETGEVYPAPDLAARPTSRAPVHCGPRLDASPRGAPAASEGPARARVQCWLLGPNPTLTLVANSQNSQFCVGKGYVKSRRPRYARQFATSVNTHVTNRKVVPLGND
jgi:hypothetical protein